MKKSFHAPLEMLDSNVYGHHFVVPKDVVSFYKKKNIKRLICEIDDITFHCGLLPKGDDSYYVLMNKENRKQLQWRIGEERAISLWEDQSKYGMPMPIEFEEALNTDAEAHRVFHNLTPGKQRSLIYMIAKPKSPDIRLRKAIIISDYLVESQGQLDYKTLNEALKKRKDEF